MPTDIASLSAGNTLGATHMNNVKAWVDDLYDAWPYQAWCWHIAATVMAGNGIMPGLNTSQPFNTMAYQNASAASDSFKQWVLLAPGTYRFDVLGVQRTNGALVDWTLDGNSIATGQDWYNGSNTDNVLQSVTGITVDPGGLIELVGTVNGVSAGSGYDVRLTAYWLTRTGA